MRSPVFISLCFKLIARAQSSDDKPICFKLIARAQSSVDKPICFKLIAHAQSSDDKPMFETILGHSLLIVGQILVYGILALHMVFGL